MSHAPIIGKQEAVSRSHSCSCHVLLPPELVVGVGIEPTFRVLQTRANPSQLSDLTEG